VDAVPAGNLLAYLQQIPDPRGRQGRRFALSAMLASVVCAILCGNRGYAAIAQWIHLQEPALWHLLGFTRRPPTRNAFRNLLLALPPEVMEEAVRCWITDVLPASLADEPLRAIAMDGKSLCGTMASHGQTVHLLSLFDQQTGCVLSQMDVDTKTNEHKTALEIIKKIVLPGRVITGDAAFCQRDLCQAIRDENGHYFFVVKDNQPSLREAIAAEFQAAFSPLHGTAAAHLA
jgi:hypothetical protein